MQPLNSDLDISRQPQPLVEARTWLYSMLRWAGVDRAVAFGISARLWSLVTGPITVLLIASRFSKELQGYYYTFSSLLALQVFLELGFGLVIMQFSSHEWSRLRLDENGAVVGDSASQARLASIARLAFRWYSVAGGLAAVGLTAAGSIFFSYSPQTGIGWFAPWLCLCFLAGITLALFPAWSILEGCNQVAEIYSYRFTASVLQNLALWSSLVLGFGLWTSAISSFVGLMWAGAFLYRRYRRFFQSLIHTRIMGNPHVSWRTELFPMQWRIALSWMSGYLQFYLFTPVLFHYHGPVVAGQMGMTSSLAGALASVSGVWVVTKAPQFGVLAAKKDYATLDRLALRAGTAACSVALTGAVAVQLGIHTLAAWKHPLAGRLLPELPSGLLLLAIVLTLIPYTQSVYLRAHRREPLVWISCACGLLIAALSILLCRRYGATGVAAGYLGVVSLVMVPGVTWIWYRCRKAWQAEAFAGESELRADCSTGSS